MSSTDSIRQVWDPAADYACLRVLRQHTGSVTHMVTYRSHLFSASYDCCVNVWNVLDEDDPPTEGATSGT